MRALVLGAYSFGADVLRFRDIPTVTLRVGKENVFFQVHLPVLCDASPAFNAAFRGEFLEASSRSIDLPEDDPEAFERLVQWLYTKSYDILPSAEEYSDDDKMIFMRLAKLYVAADKYGIVRLKNDVVDRWYKTQADRIQRPNIEHAVDYIYENTTSGSKLREIVVAHFVWLINYKWYKRPSTRIVLGQRPELATDVAIAMSQRAMDNQTNPFLLDSSYFHETTGD